MKRIEKTVFICYRRTNVSWALAIYKHLTSKGFDVFFDYRSIESGDFEQIIIENIKSRAHFIILLTPSSLESCNKPRDLFRREIETSIDTKRNIIPLKLEGFNFGIPSINERLTGKLSLLKKYQALRIPADYFEAAISRLCEKFLNVPLSTVLHPISDIAVQAIQEQQTMANIASPVQQEELTAQEWFEKGYKTTDPDEKI